MVEDIESYLQVTLTAAQESECDRLIPAVETFVDNYCGRAWLTGAISNEAIFSPVKFVWLRYPPVASVTSITGRTALGEAEVGLTVDVDYEVQDLETGCIRLISPGSYDRILVTYTPVATLPADLEQACAELVAAWMQPGLRPDSYGLDSYSLPDLTVRFSRAHVQSSAPPAVLAVLDRYAFVNVA